MATTTYLKNKEFSKGMNNRGAGKHGAGNRTTNRRGAAFSLTTVAVLIIILATVLSILLFFKGGFTTGASSIEGLLSGAGDSADVTSTDSKTWYPCPEGQAWNYEGTNEPSGYGSYSDCMIDAAGRDTTCSCTGIT